MKAYITKYALTAGIIETDQAEQLHNDSRIRANIGMDSNYFDALDWHKDKSYAINRARLMKQRRIESLKKQIKKLEAMEFK